jgi:hypothetical protein
MIIEVILYMVILATAWPCGIYLAHLCDDELVKDKIYFRLISYFLLVISIVFLIFYDKTGIVLSLVYMVFLLEVMIYKSNKIKQSKIK